MAKVEFRFSRNDYLLFCTFCRTGFLSSCDTPTSKRYNGIICMLDTLMDKEKMEFSRETFCPPVNLNLPSPLVEAAYGNSLHVVKYLLETFWNVIDIDHKATLNTGNYSYCLTPLIAACLGRNEEIITYLISKGADIHKRVSKLGTPLCVVAYKGRPQSIPVLKTLIEKGADINAINSQGVSPLLNACTNSATMVKILLDNGADSQQKTYEGFSLMHFAAKSGRTEVVKLLLSYGISPLFCPADPLKEDYIPCPLYLAAARGHKSTAEVLLNEATCPLLCKSEAYLLFASWSLRNENFKTAFEFLDSSLVKPVYLPPIVEYGFRKEIMSLNEFLSVCDTNEFLTVEVLFQSEMILDRCLGTKRHDCLFISTLLTYSRELINMQKFKEAEGLLSYAMKSFTEILLLLHNHPEYSDAQTERNVLHTLSANWVGFAYSVELLIKKIQWPVRYFDYAQFLVFALSKVKNFSCIGNLCRKVIDLFVSWIQSLVSEDKSITNPIDLPHHFHEVGKAFVNSSLYQPVGSTLLHIYITINRHVHVRDVCLFYDCLLHWGAHKVVNEPDSDSGRRPIHMAMFIDNSILKLSVVTSLLLHGAHIDAVDAHGKTAMDLSNDDCSNLVSGPLLLSCYSARTIIAKDIPYHLFDLPKHVIELIELHDSKCTMKTPQDEYFSRL